MFIGPATSALIVLGFTLLVLFVARFARTTWRRSVMGRQVMLSNGAFMIMEDQYGVGDAVNESVVITFLLLFIANFTLSAIYLEIVPPKTG